MYAEAIAAFEHVAALDPDRRCTLAGTYAQASQGDEARGALTEFLDQEPRPTGSSAGWDLAGAYAALGDTDEALQWLEAAYRERSDLMPWVKDNPAYTPSHFNPRFQDLVRRINPPQ